MRHVACIILLVIIALCARCAYGHEIEVELPGLVVLDAELREAGEIELPSFKLPANAGPSQRQSLQKYSCVKLKKALPESGRELEF